MPILTSDEIVSKDPDGKLVIVDKKTGQQSGLVLTSLHPSDWLTFDDLISLIGQLQ